MNLETMSLGARIRLIALLAAQEHVRQETDEFSGENEKSHCMTTATEAEKRRVLAASLEAA
jgi:hypothetical protein